MDFGQDEQDTTKEALRKRIAEARTEADLDAVWQLMRSVGYSAGGLMAKLVRTRHAEITKNVEKGDERDG